ncbi:MAG TPA: TIGR00282 family metallophosphoesterase [Hyphomicrobiaceae bacterium]|jgi:metallophosphoesterase (TIGR00282 family)|nr:TIGR00282 family metallophosphoesterase [Hyphomicrobiaceae bacterium]
MRLLFLGDVVGRSGRQAVLAQLPGLRRRYQLDFVAVNAENAAGGFGITESILGDLLDAGADAVTLGNHAFDQKEALVFIERQPRLLRPINYPPGTPGRGSGIFKAANGADVLVINAMGLIFMPELADPFRAIDAEVTACGLKRGADAILVDIHAEATSEKQALAYFLDGRVSLVAGTHTHAPTADERVLPEGTAFIGDLGMCGDYDSVLGMVKDEPLNRFLTKIPRARMEPAVGPATLSGVAVEIDDSTGLATQVAGLRLGGVLAPTEPRFWVDERD